MKRISKLIHLAGKLFTFQAIGAFIMLQTVYAQQKENLFDSYLAGLPEDLQLKEDQPQKYLVTTDYFNKDLYGNFFDKTRVTGNYTRGLNEGKVKWNNVRIATVRDEGMLFPEGELFPQMQNFTYVPSGEMVKAEAFKDFPPNSFHAQNLIWDMMGIETFAWTYFDSLQLNIPYSPPDINFDVELAGQGTFTNKDIKLTWTGISRMNNEICAVIDYLAMDNPLKIKNDFMEMKGRSHYWGTIWVSLKDKQIEYSKLYEDVIFELNISGQPPDQIFNTTREIEFKKQNAEL